MTISVHCAFATVSVSLMFQVQLILISSSISSPLAAASHGFCKRRHRATVVAIGQCSHFEKKKMKNPKIFQAVSDLRLTELLLPVRNHTGLFGTPTNRLIPEHIVVPTNTRTYCCLFHTISLVCTTAQPQYDHDLVHIYFLVRFITGSTLNSTTNTDVRRNTALRCNVYFSSRKCGI